MESLDVFGGGGANNDCDKIIIEFLKNPSLEIIAVMKQVSSILPGCYWDVALRSFYSFCISCLCEFKIQNEECLVACFRLFFCDPEFLM